ncbi:MAG TPA: dienelactone hydrolase family protein [Kofleriaceae bacterium]|nr:dienelactone hydrolase family protein [Kofleriaceae bacterium]
MRTNVRVVAVAAAAAGLAASIYPAGCSKDKAPPAAHDHGALVHDHGDLAAPTSTTTPTTPPAGSGAAAGTPAYTGGLDEASFKALHQLTGEHAPPLAGTTLELAGGKAYLSLPAGQPPFPALVVIHEWWGLNEHIEHWADRLAGDGYAALAVDLYGGKVATTPDDAMAAMKAVDPAQAARTISAAIDFLARDPRVTAAHRGVIGWCFGGGWALQTAIAHPELDAAVIYYGQPVTDPTMLASIKAKLLGIFANRDQSIPPAVVDRFEAALKQAGVDARILRYDADHAFANPSGAHYDQAAATAAWAEVEPFLAANLQKK